MFVSFLTYTLLFFWARGNFSAGEKSWWRCKIGHRSIGTEQRTSFRMIVSVRFNLLTILPSSDITIHRYPIVFAVTTLPLSVVRWKSGFGNNGHNFATATFTVESIYSLSGALNVLLFLSTRRDLLLPGNKLGLAPSSMSTNGQIGLRHIPPDLHHNGLGVAPSPPLASFQMGFEVTPELSSEAHDIAVDPGSLALARIPNGSSPLPGADDDEIIRNS